jgi:hypothetical protein
MVNTTFGKADFTFWPVIALVALATTVHVACADDSGGDLPALTPVEEWTAEPEYEFGDQLEGEALFGFITGVRANADGSRIHVLDSGGEDVTIWTPDGSLIQRVGRSGEGPGEFSNPYTLTLLDDGFHVVDNRRVTTFTHDGAVTGTNALPRGLELGHSPLQYRDVFPDGSHMAVPTFPWATVDGSPWGELVEESPLLRISRQADSWEVDTMAMRNIGNTWLRFPVGGSRDPAVARHPWLADDLFAADPLNGTVVVGRTRTMPPGVLELIEISTAGDTLWTRRIQLPPIVVEQQDIDDGLDRLAARVAGQSGDTVPSGRLRRSIRDAMTIPEHWPAARGMLLMSNGEIWFRPAGQENPEIWYAVRKGVVRGTIRRIVVPESLRPRDVNDTHVWGTRQDEMDVQYVVGLRLVPTEDRSP